jgi:hypothetical protein
VAVFQSPLFRKLLVSAFVLIAGALLVLDSFLTTGVAERETQSVQHRLTAEARVGGFKARDRFGTAHGDACRAVG